MNKFSIGCLVISIIGNLYLASIALFNFDVLKILFKTNQTYPKIFYIILGACGIINILLFKQLKK